MSEKFRDTDKAVSYLINGIHDDYPDAMAEVILVVKNRPSRQLCHTRDIGAVLHEMCRDFPHATVDYHPRNPYGFVAEIRSHSGGDSSHAPRNRRADHSRVIVLLTQIDGKNVVVGSQPDQRDSVAP